jgi:hypothetical protein
VKQPYRVPAGREGEKKPERTLVFTGEDSERHVGPARRFLQVFFLSSLLGSILLVCGYGVMGLLVGTGGAVWAFARAWRTPPRSGLLLNVKGGALEVVVRRSRVRLAHLPLGALEDVRLDTKTHARADRGAGAIGALHFHGEAGSREVNLARIVLVDQRGGETLLGEDWLAHVDAIEWLGTIRKFLRTHGWVPVDERREHDEHEE